MKIKKKKYYICNIFWMCNNKPQNNNLGQNTNNKKYASYQNINISKKKKKIAIKKMNQYKRCLELNRDELYHAIPCITISFCVELSSLLK